MGDKALVRISSVLASSALQALSGTLDRIIICGQWLYTRIQRDAFDGMLELGLSVPFSCCIPL